MLCKWMDVENCKFLEALDHGMLTNDRDLRLALAEVRGVKRGLKAAMRSTCSYLSITVYLESISMDQEID
jgi:hypothetical protein